jgi:hypothetical protein
VKKNNLKDEQCMVFAHRAASQSNQGGQKFRPRKFCLSTSSHSIELLITFVPFLLTAPLFQKINSALTSSLGTDIMKGIIAVHRGGLSL